ncbi:class I SAM-dependent methyltransferase [bacterium]|nr:class I SAM-dependent methyltransferase [bacterium]
MSKNDVNWYDLDPHIAQWYDFTQRDIDDVVQIRRLIGARKNMRILEPFCGTGRILIPLAQDGHELVGIDKSKALMDRARRKAMALSQEVLGRVSFIEADVTEYVWPQAFDLVILGGNCFYELATPEEQEGCIASAARALKPGGYLYYDSDHMECELAESWRQPGRHSGIIGSWTSADGIRFEWESETIWFDAPKRLWRAKRWVIVTSPDGTITTKETVQQKHPISTYEVREWLEKHGFVVEKHFGDRDDAPYEDSLERTTFWARKS